MPLKSSHTEHEKLGQTDGDAKLNPLASRSLTPKLHSLHKKVKTGYVGLFPT